MVLARDSKYYGTTLVLLWYYFCTIAKFQCTCLFCDKKGHGAQTCKKLIAWKDKQKRKHGTKFDNSSSAHTAIYSAIEHDFADFACWCIYIVIVALLLL